MQPQLQPLLARLGRAFHHLAREMVTSLARDLVFPLVFTFFNVVSLAVAVHGATHGGDLSPRSPQLRRLTAEVATALAVQATLKSFRWLFARKATDRRAAEVVALRWGWALIAFGWVRSHVRLLDLFFAAGEDRAAFPILSCLFSSAALATAEARRGSEGKRKEEKEARAQDDGNRTTSRR